MNTDSINDLSNVLSSFGYLTYFTYKNDCVSAEFAITDRPFNAKVSIMIEPSAKATLSIICPVDVGMTGYSNLQTCIFINDILSYLKMKGSISKNWHILASELVMELTLSHEFIYGSAKDIVNRLESNLYQCEIAIKHICSRFLRL